jgi:hypothetical protein
MLLGLSSSVAIGGYPQSGGLDQLPQHLAQVRRLIERMSAVNVRALPGNLSHQNPGFHGVRKSG